MDLDAQCTGQVAGILLGLRRGVGGGHDRHRDPLGAQGVRRDACDEGRIDPAGEPQHDVAEAVLLDVVVKTQRQGGVDLCLHRGKGSGELREDRIPLPRVRRREGSQDAHRVPAAAGGRPVAGIAQPCCRCRRDVHIGQQQLLAKLGRAGDRRAVVVDHARVPVEDELVLSADQSAECDAGKVVPGSLGEHPLTLGALARVVGGGRDVDDQPGARQCLLAGRRTGLPDVLADGQTDPLRADVDDRPRLAGLEVPLLVEDAIVGQVDLAVDRMHRSAGQQGRRVEDILRPLGEADDGDDSIGLAGQLVKRGTGVGQEMLLEQKILGRVSRQRELRKQDQVRFRLAGIAHAVGDAPGIARDVAHGGVHLAESEAHGPIVSSAERPPPPARLRQ